MTDKEIIIECSHINLSDWGTYSCKLYDPYISSEKALIQFGTCEANINCPYKQLQRTQQQYNQVVEQNKSLQEALKETEQNLKSETFLVTNLQFLWGKQIAEEQDDCKNINYSKPITNEIYHKITEFERTLKDVALAQSIQMGKTKPLGETGSPRSYRRWEKREKMLLEWEFLK